MGDPLDNQDDGFWGNERSSTTVQMGGRGLCVRWVEEVGSSPVDGSAIDYPASLESPRPYAEEPVSGVGTWTESGREDGGGVYEVSELLLCPSSP